MPRCSVDDPPSLARHREMLVVALVGLALAFVLEVRPDERVALRGLSGFPLPPLCATKAWLDTDCPACGLTRSLVHLSRGDWISATRVHRLGPLFAAALLLQVPYRLFGLLRRDPAPLGRLIPALFGYVLILALLFNWVWNNLPAAGAVP
jgi:hypothetical protein